jgi:glutaredoxin
MLKNTAITLLTVAYLSLQSPALAGAIFKWKDADGKLHIGDRPPTGVEANPVTVRINTYQETGSTGASAKAVLIYTTVRCGYCKKAKAFLQRKGIPYQEYDVETSRKGQRDYKKLKGTGVPIILVGDNRLNGFSEIRLSTVLEKAGYSL